MEPTLRRLALASLLVACTPQPAPQEPSAAVSPPVPVPVPVPDAGPTQPVATAEAGAPPTPRPTCDMHGVPRVLTKIACVEDYDHLQDRVAGFSKDGTWLGMCISDCDPCPTECRFSDARGQTKKLRYWSSLEDPLNRNGTATDAQLERSRNAHDAPLAKFMKAADFPTVKPVRVMRGPWPYADMVFEVRSSADTKKGTGVLEVGASVDGSSPVFPIRLEVGPHPMWTSPIPKEDAKKTGEAKKKAIEEWRATWQITEAHLAAIDTTPDGSQLGAVAFGPGSMMFEASAQTRMATGAFAAKVYEGAAAEAQKNGDASKAAALLQKAADAKKQP